MSSRKQANVGFIADIAEVTRTNTDYRRVIYTGKRMQVVVMSLRPGESIGLESHPHVEQLFVIVSGVGRADVGDIGQRLNAGTLLLVQPKTKHNVTNTGRNAMKLFTVYAPPNHIDGTVHRTRRSAEADKKDEAFGRRVR